MLGDFSWLGGDWLSGGVRGVGGVRGLFGLIGCLGGCWGFFCGGDILLCRQTIPGGIEAFVVCVGALVGICESGCRVMFFGWGRGGSFGMNVRVGLVTMGVGWVYPDGD